MYQLEHQENNIIFNFQAKLQENSLLVSAKSPCYKAKKLTLKGVSVGVETEITKLEAKRSVQLMLILVSI